VPAKILAGIEQQQKNGDHFFYLAIALVDHHLFRGRELSALFFSALRSEISLSAYLTSAMWKRY
jgi:hypothetical protein